MVRHARFGIIKYILMTVMLFAVPIGVTTYCTQRKWTESMTFSSGVTIYTETRLGVMDAEAYLVGMVAAQIEPTVPKEMLKVQAVLARTLLYERLGGQQSGEATMLGVAALTQKEMKERWGGDYEADYQAVLQAVKETKGEIATYQKQPIIPAFFSVSSGRTRSANAAWGQEIPYLNQVDSPMDEASLQYLWTNSFSRKQVIALLKAVYPEFNAQQDTLSETFQVMQTDGATYVQKLQIGNKILTGEAFRYALDLPSACFEVTFTPKEMIVTTKGLGHGVGLSQYGGAVMAENGSTYAEILSYYFPETALQKIW